MKRRLFLACMLCIGLTSNLLHASQDGTNPMIKMTTSLGSIEIELYPDTAPASVENFLAYVNSGFYDGTIFHRVIPGFMVQGGGFTGDMQQKSTGDPIVNEADNGLANDKGTLAMARTPDPDSATAQFFINLVDNDFLNFKSKTPQGWGYAVFGKVTSGMDVVEAMARVQTGNVGHHGDVPLEPITIEKAEVIDQ